MPAGLWVAQMYWHAEANCTPETGKSIYTLTAHFDVGMLGVYRREKLL
jgi:hypothetical protein